MTDRNEQKRQIDDQMFFLLKVVNYLKKDSTKACRCT